VYIETMGLDKLITGQIDELIELGGLSQSRDEQGSEIASRNKYKHVDRRRVFIKVWKR
jgi:hypothetical protein